MGNMRTRDARKAVRHVPIATMSRLFPRHARTSAQISPAAEAMTDPVEYGIRYIVEECTDVGVRDLFAEKDKRDSPDKICRQDHYDEERKEYGIIHLSLPPSA